MLQLCGDLIGNGKLLLCKEINEYQMVVGQESISHKCEKTQPIPSVTNVLVYCALRNDFLQVIKIKSPAFYYTEVAIRWPGKDYTCGSLQQNSMIERAGAPPPHHFTSGHGCPEDGGTVT